MAVGDFADDGVLADVDAGAHGRLAVHEKREGKRQVAATVTGRNGHRWAVVLLLLVFLASATARIHAFLRLDKPFAQTDEIPRQQTPAQNINKMSINELLLLIWFDYLSIRLWRALKRSDRHS